MDDAPFRRARMEGGFVLRRPCSARGDVVAGALVDTRLVPASTFKIANTLIALQTGVVTDPDALRPWDGVERTMAAWNGDHSLRTAMRDSVVWFYQALAREIGPERMRHFLGAFRYGNMEIGPSVDTFWLGGPLEVTAREQVDFLSRALLQPGTEPLPEVEPRHLATLRSILPTEAHGEMLIRAKTGMYLPQPSPGGAVRRAHGWLVGVVGPARDLTSTAHCHQHAFALVLQAEVARADEVREQRWPVARELLRMGGYIP